MQKFRIFITDQIELPSPDYRLNHIFLPVLLTRSSLEKSSSSFRSNGICLYPEVDLGERIFC
ncbi:hypothetical protein BpHYR1_041771 [Brachionus plicatilis]|uniref:Uncharacterized protein n=1 Tax=Brachionus plicatilis TaxID=10195 RepID=A0A3M7PPG9_BRAPC|nr:hypothetical protein BpHYR1_041771 [Brachionus plicatilis]